MLPALMPLVALKGHSAAQEGKVLRNRSSHREFRTRRGSTTVHRCQCLELDRLADHQCIDCPRVDGHRLFDDAHGAMRTLVWHKDQKAVSALILAICTETYICLGLIDDGQHKSTNRLLVLVPHDRPHGVMRIHQGLQG